MYVYTHTCIPTYLHIRMSVYASPPGRPDTFVFGKKEQLEVDVRVVNDGEDAFEALVFVPIPRGLLYNKFVAKDNTTVVCSPRTMDSGMILVCDIGNPLPMHKGVSAGAPWC